MEFAFYICGLIAILATLRVITHTNPVHALLYLIISLLAISGVFFSLGAYFAGALEIIVYAGAILVLFVFMPFWVLTIRASTGRQLARKLSVFPCSDRMYWRSSWLRCCCWQVWLWPST